jgi:glycosyltransferase involved in cell wall biosynthesis
LKKIKILISIYNDWKSVFKLLENIDLQVAEWDAEVSILIINDASTENQAKTELSFKKIKLVRVINMKQNRGHARCNAAGLKYLTEKESFDYVILMDGDGEDRPKELTPLFNKSKENPSKTVTLNRIKRSEGVFFKLFYECHKILTYIFTGKLIKFGNYSCLPKEHATRLLKEACLWSSFSGTVTKVMSDRVSIPSIRGQRYFGPSQMNLFNLLVHSFSIIAVFRGTVIIRSILFLFIYLFFVFNSLSITTLFPVLILLIFLLLIFKVSSRENIEELNHSLENIGSINVLGDFNGR